MKRAIAAVVLTVLALVAIGAGPAPLKTERRAEAAAFIDLGKDDTLVVLTPWETAWLANALQNNLRTVCYPPLIPLKRVAKFFNKFCSGYGGYTRVAYWQVKFFLKHAVRTGGCGAFVLDGARWRPTRARTATIWGAPAINGDTPHVATQYGRSALFKRGDGTYTRINCNEYRFPERQTNITPKRVPGVPDSGSGLLPAAPQGPSAGGR